MDYKEQLKKQLRFIESSAESYDSGETDEGIRIATSLRVLFHQTTRSTSLMTLMAATNIHLLSTNAVKSPGPDYFALLANIQFDPIEGWARFIPKLDTAPKRLIPLESWWQKEIIYSFHSTNATRKNLVLSASNKDGGAHVDSDLSADYNWLSRHGSGWKLIRRPDGAPNQELYFEITPADSDMPLNEWSTLAAISFISPTADIREYIGTDAVPVYMDQPWNSPQEYPHILFRFHAGQMVRIGAGTVFLKFE